MKRKLQMIVASLLLPLAMAATAADFDIDTSHSSVYFSVSHFQRSSVRGRILQVSGRIQFDAQQQRGKVEVSLPVDALDTGIAALDNVLKSPQFFDAERFPLIVFKSEQFEFDGERLLAVSGNLTVHGVTQPVRLSARRFQCGQVKLGLLKREVCGGEFHATLLRSQFGMQRFLPDVGDEVELLISIEASPAH